VCCSDRVTLAVLELIESGCLQSLRTKWWLEKGECSGKDGPPKKVGVLVVHVGPQKCVNLLVKISLSSHRN